MQERERALGLFLLCISEKVCIQSNFGIDSIFVRPVQNISIEQTRRERGRVHVLVHTRGVRMPVHIDFL